MSKSQGEPPLQLSSMGTVLYRIAGGSILLTALLVTLSMFVSDDADLRKNRWFFLAATVLWSTQLYWCLLPLKSVGLRSNALLVWSHGKEVKIPLSSVEYISTSPYLVSGPVWLHFRAPTELGSKLAFLPAWRWQAPGSVEHPLIGDLRRRVRAASASVAPSL